MRSIFVTLLILGNLISIAQTNKGSGIYSGIPWFDTKGNTVSAHGANIVRDKGKYYLFGERHTDTSNAFAGFNCYSIGILKVLHCPYNHQVNWARAV
jgi:hypothetical protein